MTFGHFAKNTARGLIERVVAYSPGDDFSKIATIIDSYSVVSFDIFDTLIRRDVGDPAGVFDLVESAFNNSCPRSLPLRDFRKMRNEAEREAREALRGDREETSLQEIYQHISRSEDDCDRLRDLEIEVEKKVSCAAMPLLSLLRAIRDAGKRVVVVSDMYLPEDVVRSILVSNGVEFDALYLSSSYGCMKKTGSLFRVMLREEGIAPQSVVHIGDNIRSDFYMARRAGIRSILIRDRSCTEFGLLPISGKSRESSVWAGTLNSVSENHASHLTSYYERFGWDVFGPLLFGLVRLIQQTCAREGIKKVFFLARDGYVVKQAFDAFIGNEGGIESTYLYASRRAFGVPSVVSYEDFLDIVPGSKATTFGELLDAVGVEEYPLPPGYKVTDFTRAFRRANPNEYDCYLHGLYNDMRGKAKTERGLVRRYFVQEGVEGKVLLFDVGWAGSIQYFINKLICEMGIDASSVAVYLGCLPGHMRKGVSFCSLMQRRPDAYYGIVEPLFFAPEGSCKKFVLTREGKVVPELCDFEYDDYGIIDERRAIGEIQRGALDFIKRLKVLLPYLPKDYPAPFSFIRLENVGLRPTKADIDHLADLRYFSFGRTSYTAKPRKLGFYLLHLRALSNDFSDSRWKIAFMKRLLRVPVHYEKIYSFALGVRARAADGWQN